MEFNIRNCNNIENGLIEILPNKLNIRYGINGTGKSTIAKAITLKLVNGDLSSLKPFNTDDAIIPSVDITPNITKVKVYNDDYVSQYLFLNNGENLHQNSFEVFVKPTDYDEKISSINEILGIVKDFVSENEILNNLITQRNEMAKILKLNSGQTSINNTGLGKALNTGNRISRVPEDVNMFGDFLTNNTNNVKWFNWHTEGRDYIKNNKCPFCTSVLINNFNELITRIDELFDKKNVESIIKGSTIIQNISENLSENANAFLSETFTNENAISNENKSKIARFVVELDKICENVSFFINLNYVTLKNINNIEEEVSALKINVGDLEFFSNETVTNIITSLNEKIDELLHNIQSLREQLGRLNSSIRGTTTRNVNRINDFLRTVGMKYNVQIVENKMILNYEGTDIIVDPNTHLSWGEKNCFALALFLFDCLYENSDLIILDDPVSSFDFNKKYAITHYLFNSDNSLKNKTVLMLTHDLEPIINMLKVSNIPFVDCSYIENNGGALSEHHISQSDVNSIIDVAKNCFSQTNLNIINRLIHLRRFLELNNDYDFEYNLISSLLKGYQIPKYRNRLNDRDFTTQEISRTELNINEHINGFDYNSILSTIRDINQMKVIYNNPNNNNYEKMEIFRIMCKTFPILNVDDVLAKFINEAFHIENTYIFQLDPYAYNLVPNYIITKCDSIIDRVNTQITPIN